MDQPSYENEERPNGKKTLWIIGGAVLVLMIVAVVYGATQNSLKNPTADNLSQGTVQPSTGSATSPQGSTAVLGASDRIAVVPTITGMDVVNLQTFPYQVQARISGAVSDGCSTFDAPTVVRSGKTFTVSVTASHPKDSICTQVVTSQTVITDIPVAGIAAGKYAVKLGKISKSFTLSADNTVQYTNDK